jgi:hypothetical protein
LAHSITKASPIPEEAPVIQIILCFKFFFIFFLLEQKETKIQEQTPTPFFYSINLARFIQQKKR